MKSRWVIVPGVVLFVIMLTFIQPYPFPNSSVIGAGNMTEQSVTYFLFNQYILPFEIVTFLLLAGMLGAMYLGERDD